MFTGIIEEVGKITRINKQGEFAVVTIQASKVLQDVHLGDSIAVSDVRNLKTHLTWRAKTEQSCEFRACDGSKWAFWWAYRFRAY